MAIFPIQRRWMNAVFHLLLWVGVAIFIFRFIRIAVAPAAAVEILAMRLGIFILVFYCHSELLIPKLLFRKRYVAFVLSVAGVLALATALRVAYEQAFLMEVLRKVPIYDDDVQVVVAFVSMGTIALISLFYKLGQRQLQKEREQQALIAQQQEAEIQLLRAQLNPHFLFNMLNNIYSLSISQSPKAPDFILKLSELMRYITYDSREDRVSLAREVHFIGVFIDIFQLKSAKPLPVSFEVSGDPGQLQAEPLLLLPLVENAFKHCDFEVEAAFLKIRLDIHGGGFTCQISNSKGIGNERKSKEGGVGLENIRKRMALRKEEGLRLKVSDSSHSFSVTLYHPLHG